MTRLVLFVALLAGCYRCPDGDVTSDPDSCDQGPTVCYRVCDSGQACGDSCIAWEDECHLPPGSACQGAYAMEVTP